MIPLISVHIKNVKLISVDNSGCQKKRLIISLKKDIFSGFLKVAHLSAAIY